MTVPYLHLFPADLRTSDLAGLLAATVGRNCLANCDGGMFYGERDPSQDRECLYCSGTGRIPPDLTAWPLVVDLVEESGDQESLELALKLWINADKADDTPRLRLGIDPTESYVTCLCTIAGQDNCNGMVDIIRGFPAVITCTAETWEGVVCERCGGTVRFRSYHPVEIEHVYDCDSCTNGRITGLHERVYWHHSQTVPCGECKNHPGRHGPGMWSQHYACLQCAGLGTLPRTPPAGWLPALEEVRLTTMPAGEWESTAEAKQDLERRWPGLRFDLSRAEPAATMP